MIFVETMLDGVDDDLVPFLEQKPEFYEKPILTGSEHISDIRPKLLKIHWLANLRQILRLHVGNDESKFLSVMIHLKVPNNREVDWGIVKKFCPETEMQKLMVAIHKSRATSRTTKDCTRNLKISAY